jgi:hypothetical protein
VLNNVVVWGGWIYPFWASHFSPIPSSKKTKKPPFGDLFYFVAGVAGFEPTITIPKTDALPLGYTPILRLDYN